ncbi:MAG: nitroreductase family protein [Planctomycetota bacterium]
MLELLRRRRSVRAFADRKIAPEILIEIEEVLLRAPSSRNLRPWEFVLVDDAALIKKLSRAKEHGSAFLKRAPLAVVVAADPKASDTWVEDCAIASILLQMYVESRPGMGSCWIQIRLRTHDETTSAEDYVKKVLNLPARWVVESILAVGYEAEREPPVPLEDLPRGKIHRNGMGGRKG